MANTQFQHDRMEVQQIAQITADETSKDPTQGERSY